MEFDRVHTSMEMVENEDKIKRHKTYYRFVAKNRLVKDNLKRCIEHNRIFGYEEIAWRNPYEKYINAEKTRHRNCDQRMHFKYWALFVTMKFFTFGNTAYHIYQTLTKQMITYV
ncbi:hypothetical protein AVEN_88479-1 [Araneus ventricosus]|uniref:Uncharacterized protein n=1 Tax=Araneus ventricosus TaxID=182803 RepID=A0A4Y2TMW7_ARAVE|nr:hypothetical protein AVEN_88479-1 [Araneus ventricosus]